MDFPQIDNVQAPMPMPMETGFENSPVSMSNANSETIRWLEDSREMLEEIELTLSNKELHEDKDGNVGIRDKKYGERFMNDDAVNTIMSILRPHINKNVFLSNFTDEDIDQIMQKLHIKISMLIGVNTKEFGIKETNLHTIVEICTNPIFSAYKRAAHEGERNMFTRTQRGVETRVHNEDGGRGIFSRFMP
jgi:hypothetical protein